MSGAFDSKDPIDAELERKADRALEPVVVRRHKCIMVPIEDILGPQDFDISEITKERDGK